MMPHRKSPKTSSPIGRSMIPSGAHIFILPAFLSSFLKMRRYKLATCSPLIQHLCTRAMVLCADARHEDPLTQYPVCPMEQCLSTIKAYCRGTQKLKGSRTQRFIYPSTLPLSTPTPRLYHSTSAHTHPKTTSPFLPGTVLRPAATLPSASPQQFQDLQ